MKKILIIEDDITILTGLENAFTFHDFSVLACKSGHEGFDLFKNHKADLIILDIMLPDGNGFELCRKIRSLDETIPIVMLTAKNEESDKLLGFELGADDYVTKPFSANELISRVRAILKRTGRQKSVQNTVLVGQAQICFNQFLIKKGTQEFSLSPKEQEILLLLIENTDAVVSRNQIIDEVWGDEYFPSPKTIDNFIVKLRGKIEPDPKNPCHIITVHGAGYKFRF